MAGFEKTIPDIPSAAYNTSAAPAHAGVATAIQGFSAIAGQTALDVQKGKLTQDIQQTANVTDAIAGAQKSGATFDPAGNITNLDSLPPDMQARVRSTMQAASYKFQTIAQGVAQGAIPKEAAALQLEASVKHLVNQTPGFGNEIRQLARDLAGFDPTGHTMQTILNINTPKEPRAPQTQTEKDQEEALAIQKGYAGIGINMELSTILGNVVQKRLTDYQATSADNLLKMNTISINQWAQKRFVERGADVTGSLARIAQMGAAGGVDNPQLYTNAFAAQKEADKAAFRQEVAKQGGMKTDDMMNVERQIDAMYAPIEASIKENRFDVLLKDKLNTLAQVNALWGYQATPYVMRMNDAYGPQISAQFLQMMADTADPKQFSLIYQFDPGLKAMIEEGKLTQTQASQGIAETTRKIMAGEDLSEADLQFRPLSDSMAMRKGSPESRAQYLTGMGATQPVRASSLIATVPRQAATKDEVKFIKSQFDVYIGHGSGNTENGPVNLIDTAAAEIAAMGVMGTLKVENGKLVIKPDKGAVVSLGGAFTGQTPSMKRLQVFIDAANNGYSQDFGVNQATFPEELVRRIKQASSIQAGEIPK